MEKKNFAHLEKEWHPNKNFPLIFNEFLLVTRRYWWLCTLSHEWETTLDGRIRGSGCPYCGGKRVLAGFNDLATHNPKLASEWHPTKNGNLTAKSVGVSSRKKVWWLASCGHEWDSNVADRSRRDSGCVICSGRRILTGFNDLVTKYSDLAAEWHPTKNNELLPQQTAVSSNRNIWWLGICGHEWQATVANRTRNGTGCSVCSSRTIFAGFNDLATTSPSLTLEWHPSRNIITPQEISAGSEKRVWWLCTLNHEWEISPSGRARGEGCPYCAGQKVLLGFNDVATTHPHLISEWHPNRNGDLTPQQIIAGSKKKVWWVGNKCGHEWETSLNHRTAKNTGCPYCVSKRVLVGFNDLASFYPAIAAEWHPTKNRELTAEQITPQSNKIVWWLGVCGHEWKSAPNHRTARGDGCPYCSGYTVLTGFNDLVTTHPKIAAEWHPTRNGKILAKQVGAGSHKKTWWLGVCGHEWSSSPENRKKGDGCPICSNKILLIGFNDLATTHPVLAAEWHPTKNGKLTARQTVAGSPKRVWWLGKCGHQWESNLTNRTRLKVGCPICAGQTVLAGFNDLATTYPLIAAEWHPTKNGELATNQITAGSNKQFWWLGGCGHEWRTVVHSRTKRGSGCPKCVNQVSKPEERIKEFLIGLGLAVEGSNWTMLKPKRSQLDLWIPEKNVAIEFNGIHWHKEKYRGRDSHYNKWLDCKNKGIQLIQIWEDDWNSRSEIVMRGLADKLGVSKTVPVLRDTKVISITEQQTEEFLTENHLQGFAFGSYYLGLAATGDIEKLQAVMVLGDDPNNEGRSLEIIRYASIGNVNEDFSKLLSHAINAYSPESITVIADHCEANEGLYESNDFIAEKELPPDYMYVIRTERKPRSEYPLERFRDDPKLQWEDCLTEMELADLNGLKRIWDAGKTRYRLVL